MQRGGLFTRILLAVLTCTGGMFTLGAIAAAPQSVVPVFHERSFSWRQGVIVADETSEPDAAPSGFAEGEPFGEVAGGGGCSNLGSVAANQQSFTNTLRFRGNMFRVDQPGFVPEFGFRLQIPLNQPIDLYFSVLETPNGQGTLPFVRVPLSSEENDVILHVVGTGQAQYYMTGPLALPIQLVSGKEYIFGVAWNSPGVTYGRNPAESPGTRFDGFPNAIFRGSVSLTLNAAIEPPLDPDNMGINVLPSQTGGPWFMRMCLAGACCLTGEACDGGGPNCCRDLSIGECQQNGGAFSDAGVTCAVLTDPEDPLGCPLVQGACCLSESSCSPLDRFTCDNLDGTWIREQVCTETICLPKGACCLSDGDCLNNVLQMSCLDVGGNYRGDDTDCDTVEPRCTVGACCLSGTQCTELNPTACTNAGGEFQGFGEACSPVNPCEKTGACCLGLNNCSDMTGAACASAGGTYRGDDTACATIVVKCGRGACCSSSQGCLDGGGAGVAPSTCTSVLQGTFQGEGTSCRTIDPPCKGTCCGVGVNGCIQNVDPVTCTDELVGNFGGYNIACGSCPMTGLGACCLPTADCTSTTQSLCNALHGTMFHAGVSCGQVNCTVASPTGACCKLDESCSIITQSQCQSVQGQVYQGDGSTCTAGACTRGACCRVDGSCFSTVVTGCSSVGGTFNSGETCEVCAAAGACCIANADPGSQCQMWTPSACASLFGSFQGEGIACGPTTCKFGACCLDETCSSRTPEFCAANGGMYRGDESTCIPSACVNGACCTDIGDCADLIGFHCADAGGTFAPGSLCSDDVCPEAGACCLTVGGCDSFTQMGCMGAGGTFAGEGTACPTDCVVGACCELDGSCTDDAHLFECDQGIHHAGHPCGEVECSPIGACCYPTSCTIDTEANCNLSRGEYQGDETSCTPDPCGSPLTLMGSDPPSGAIDARQPSDISGANPIGWTQVKLTFDGDTASLSTTDFSVTTTGGTAPTVANVIPSGNDITVQFNTFIPPGYWTMLTYNGGTAGSTGICLGYLPGDVNQDDTAAAPDILGIIDCINGTAPFDCNEWNTDIDRSDPPGMGIPQAPDILRVIDLLNGAGGFMVWRDVSLPASPCTGP